MNTKKQFNNNSEYSKLFIEVKKNIVREHFQKNINSVLAFLNNLAENNANEAETLSKHFKEKSVLMKSVKVVQSLTQKIASKLNLILSQYPEDKGLLIFYY